MAGVLILIGLWSGYLALICFFSILIPPFLFAIAGTLIFGAGALFCLEAAKGAMSTKPAYSYDEYDDYSGGGGVDDVSGLGPAVGEYTHGRLDYENQLDYEGQHTFANEHLPNDHLMASGGGNSNRYGYESYNHGGRRRRL